MAKKIQKDKDLSTEARIREAARKVFLKKGYSGARTRDIAEEAGINLALLNYYFRSKEKLFEQVMLEKMQKLFGQVLIILNQPDNSVEEKIENFTAYYIEMLLENPDLPLFVLSEIHKSAENITHEFQPQKILLESVFVKQLAKSYPHIHPLQFLFSLLGMTIFPFIARPLLNSSGTLPQDIFQMMMKQREVLIPKWADAILKIKE
ncbi:MAG: TetR/AcrR family transcriptional regulator [Bacteroidetes bacterium]|nr:TetR/AcrR family transcriptional regulator [Bacteroidota bacterium]